jgi:metal-responsive CopG/Arc/MetJ family transcriptional regulator
MVKMRQRVNVSLKPTLVRKFDRARRGVPRSVIIAKLLENFIEAKWPEATGATAETVGPSIPPRASESNDAAATRRNGGLNAYE